MLGISSKSLAAFCILTAVAMVTLLVGCGGSDGASSGGTSQQSRIGSYDNGERLFGENCAACHGATAEGTTVGPPLVHAVYNPNHHPDFSFHNAVNDGVPQHHWAFGDMEPRPGLSGSDVNDIICYVRQLQVDEGIYEGEAC